jgi:hypothetical protein
MIIIVLMLLSLYEQHVEQESKMDIGSFLPFRRDILSICLCIICSTISFFLTSCLGMMHQFSIAIEIFKLNY